MLINYIFEALSECMYSFQVTLSHGNGKVLVRSGIGGPVYHRDRM